MSAVAHGDHGLLEDCSGLGDTAMEELGHHSFGLIEPRDDRCIDDPENGDQSHDRFEDYAMDSTDCDAANEHVDWYDPSTGEHRWTELEDHVMAEECTDAEAADSMTCPSPGDLNNGLFPGDVDQTLID
jgi:hypothetical protein